MIVALFTLLWKHDVTLNFVRTKHHNGRANSARRNGNTTCFVKTDSSLDAGRDATQPIWRRQPEEQCAQTVSRPHKVANLGYGGLTVRVPLSVSATPHNLACGNLCYFPANSENRHHIAPRTTNLLRMIKRLHALTVGTDVGRLSEQWFRLSGCVSAV